MLQINIQPYTSNDHLNIILSFGKFHPCDTFIIHVVNFMNIVSIIHVFSFMQYILLKLCMSYSSSVSLVMHTLHL
jgi:hypothetical protein